ncbi:hypothetical protein ABPG75_004224 [Micractinium tetrahymenae]
MPQTKRAEPPTEEEKARIVTGPDPDRFYCPHPGCNRSFAELWRLKVHFRAPPDVRGSGKERGHGTELQFCPKCGKDLRPGKHHVGCSAGKSAPRQAAKRQRQQQMSTTTESAGLTTGTTEQTTTGSWELTAPARRPPAKTQRQASEAESAQRTKRAAEAAAAAAGGQPGELVYQPSGPMGAGGHMLPPGQHMQGFYPQHQGGGAAPPPAGAQQHAAPPAPLAPLPHLDLPHHPAGEARPHSPSPLDLFGDPFAGATNGQHGGGGRGGGDGLHGLLDEDELLRIPSPPPLPAEWESAAARPGMLFDFDQFDISKRQQQTGGASAPLVTVTTAMNPVDVLNPSDDYIWQILFAGENDAVPKRVTAHLHHPPATALSYLDDADTDPLLDAILADDLPPAPPGFDHQQHHDFLGPLPGEDGYHGGAAHAAHGGSGSGGSGGTVPGGDSGHGASGGTMLHGMDGLLGQQQVVPQQPHPSAHHGQHVQHHGQHAQHVQHAGQLPYRNGYGGHGGGELPPVKVEGTAAAAAGGGFI